MVSERAMREIYLKGFGICVRESQPKAVMTSYNLLNGTHTAESRGLVMDILRAEFGYQGIVMTDWVTPTTGDARSATGIRRRSMWLRQAATCSCPATRVIMTTCCRASPAVQ